MDSRASLPSLSIGERIVWISDIGPEYGYVRWLGKLPDIGDDWMAGVEFDNPVGTGTGLYRDQQLFESRMNHASLVPIIGLMKATDFEDSEPKAGQRSPPFSHKIASSTNSEQPALSTYNNSHSSHQPKSSSPRDNLRYDIIRKRLASLGKSLADHRLIPESHQRVKSSSNDHYDPVRYKSSPQSFVDRNSGRYKESDRNKSIDHHDITTQLDDLELLPESPLSIGADDANSNKSLRSMLGKSRGIQGHNNSCYLDATLFAMFSANTVFESLLYRPSNANDIPEYSQVQRVLREDIVRSLRRDFFVSANQVMTLRTLLEKLSSVEGLTDEEKDPEEFLTLLLNQILRAEPYLKLSSGLESFFYQLIMDKDENIVLPTVQDLFDQSCLGNGIRLREVPPCLLLQMPRFGRQYKMYSRIVPSMQLDITDVLESSPRACGQITKNCDNLACFECKDCFGERGNRFNTRLSNITYCKPCFQTKHFSRSHSTGIEDHNDTKTIIKPGKLNREVQQRFSGSSSSSKTRTIPRVYMDLFAVLCIETSHYVCFVKCDNTPDSPWVFFDSMADRKGEQNGYNIPEVTLFEDLPFWLSDKGIAYLLNNRDDKLLPEMSRRLICDAYMCFYQSPDLCLYR